jgi:hypothetical protein
MTTILNSETVIIEKPTQTRGSGGGIEEVYSYSSSIKSSIQQTLQKYFVANNQIYHQRTRTLFTSPKSNIDRNDRVVFFPNNSYYNYKGSVDDATDFPETQEQYDAYRINNKITIDFGTIEDPDVRTYNKGDYIIYTTDWEILNKEIYFVIGVNHWLNHHIEAELEEIKR